MTVARIPELFAAWKDRCHGDCSSYTEQITDWILRLNRIRSIPHGRLAQRQRIGLTPGNSCKFQTHTNLELTDNQQDMAGSSELDALDRDFEYTYGAI
jgi:hypothetical protein